MKEVLVCEITNTNIIRYQFLLRYFVGIMNIVTK